MASYVKFTLDDGTEVYIESVEASKSIGGLIPTNRGESSEGEKTASFEKSFGPVRKLAAAMVDGLKEGFTTPPEEVSISFGLKAIAELGTLVVARGGMESNFSVNLRWRKAEEKPEEKKEAKNEEA